MPSAWGRDAQIARLIGLPVEEGARRVCPAPGAGSEPALLIPCRHLRRRVRGIYPISLRHLRGREAMSPQPRTRRRSSSGRRSNASPGIEFDYCSLPLAWRQGARVRTIMVNSNPETVSRLRQRGPPFFRALTLEDVLDGADENGRGGHRALGGQTPLNPGAGPGRGRCRSGARRPMPSTWPKTGCASRAAWRRLAIPSPPGSAGPSRTRARGGPHRLPGPSAPFRLSRPRHGIAYDMRRWSSSWPMPRLLRGDAPVLTTTTWRCIRG